MGTAQRSGRGPNGRVADQPDRMPTSPTSGELILVSGIARKVSENADHIPRRSHSGEGAFAERLLVRIESCELLPTQSQHRVNAGRAAGRDIRRQQSDRAQQSRY